MGYVDSLRKKEFENGIQDTVELPLQFSDGAILDSHLSTILQYTDFRSQIFSFSKRVIKGSFPRAEQEASYFISSYVLKA